MSREPRRAIAVYCHALPCVMATVAAPRLEKPMTSEPGTIRPPLGTSERLAGVRYEIRGPLARRAHELELKGYEIVYLNIGNPGRFGFRTPESMRQAVIENLPNSEAYCHQKGIFPAREAVVMQQQNRGVTDVTAEEVFLGNGVSELIDLTLRALLNSDDEVLVPSPDYPLWTAAVILNGGKAVHYPCHRENGFVPTIDDIAALVTEKSRAIVLINPNNPTGACYPQKTIEQVIALANERNLLVMSDEIYDDVLFDGAQHVPVAPLMKGGRCATFGGLSKVYRACGYRGGWVSFTGMQNSERDYLQAVELLASLRLCANVPSQWAVQTALGGRQSIRDLTCKGGRLHESREAVIRGVEKSDFLSLVAPAGAMYAFVQVSHPKLPVFDDYQFAMDLLEQKHVLVAPGSSFNYAHSDSFRITILPEAKEIEDVFERIDALLRTYVAA